MARSSVAGPALGGIVAIPLKTKIASVAGLGDVDEVPMPAACYVCAYSGVNAGTAGTTFAADTGTERMTQLLQSSAVTGPHLHTNRGDGETAITPAVQGFAVAARVAGAAAAAEKERFLDRRPSAYPGTGRAHFLQHTGVGVGTLECTMHAFVAIVGHPYDPDNPAAGATRDFPYTSVDD